MKIIAPVVFAILMLAGIGLAIQPPPQHNPWWRPLNPFGQSAGVTYGTADPTEPRRGEIRINMDYRDVAGNSVPALQFYDPLQTPGWVANLYSNSSITMESGQSSIAIRTVASGTSINLVPGNLGRMLLWAGQETMQRQGSAIAVVGAGQTIDPLTNYFKVSAAAPASVTNITIPAFAGGSWSALITVFCADANVTINDTDAGAATTIDLAGAGVNFVCSVDDTITLAFDDDTDRWLEVARSVN